MEVRVCHFWVIICVVGTALSAVLFHNIVYFWFPDLLLEEANSQHDIIIGVLSARGNTAQRQAIRETWAGYIKNHAWLRDKLMVRFIIGKDGCNVPREFLENLYSCRSIALETSAMDLASEMVAFNMFNFTKLPKKTHRYPEKSLNAEYYGLDFTMNYPVVIKKLGLQHDAVSLHQNCTIILYDTWSKEPVIQVEFSSQDPGTLQDGVRFKTVEEYLFPKDFQGTLVIGPLHLDNPSISGDDAKQHRLFMPSNAKVLSIKPFLRSSKTGDFPEEINFPNLNIFPGRFIFKFYEPEEVEKLMASKVQAEELLFESNRKETLSLHDEQQQFGDVLLVDEVDVYRNIPKKMLQFFRWVISTSAADFIIKTDDDCFVNIDNIMATLQDETISVRSHSWWGSFRTNWPLDLLGKWAEHAYPAPVYPAFACGSGNLLTRDLVQWIASNSKVLHPYQGEDVSMGIWLASILPSYVNDRRWACDAVCHQDVFVLPEQSPEQLRTVWRNWLQCKDPCGCYED